MKVWYLHEQKSTQHFLQKSGKVNLHKTTGQKWQNSFFLTSAVILSSQQYCASVFWTTKAFPGKACRSGCENATVASSIYQQPSGSRGSVKGAILHQGWMPTEASICKVFPAKTPGHCALVSLTSRPHGRRAGSYATSGREMNLPPPNR